jgi:hypothetical protein
MELCNDWYSRWKQIELLTHGYVDVKMTYIFHIPHSNTKSQTTYYNRPLLVRADPLLTFVRLSLARESAEI